MKLLNTEEMNIFGSWKLCIFVFIHKDMESPKKSIFKIK